MNLDDIRLLISVAEEGSLQGAARACSMARTTLRRRLNNLEASTGQTLLVVDKRGARLTPAGFVVLEYGRTLLKHHSTMLSQLREVRPSASGLVRIVVPAGLPCALRVQLLRTVRELHPDLKIDDREVERPLDELRSDFDVLAHWGAPPDSGDWYSVVIARIPIHLHASSAYLDRHGPPTTLDGLAGHPLISWKSPHFEPTRWPLIAGGAVDIEPWLVSPRIRLVVQASAEGLGIVMSPAIPPVDFPTLVPVMTDIIGTRHELRLLFHSRTDARIRALLDNLRESEVLR